MSENGRQSQGWIVNHEENDAGRRLPPPGRVTRQHDVYTSSQVEGLGVMCGGAIADAVGRNGHVDKFVVRVAETRGRRVTTKESPVHRRRL
jgi:hypothetical protein